MTTGFPHQSRPGHYALTLSDEMQQYLAMVAEALIPGTDSYPSGREAHADLFVAERASAQDASLLAAIADRWPATSVDQATTNLTAMEGQDVESFGYLREFIYHGYYSSHLVLSTMATRGYRYHGAPQPLGYPRTEELLVPTARRGAYIPTDKVNHVGD